MKAVIQTWFLAVGLAVLVGRVEGRGRPWMKFQFLPDRYQSSLWTNRYKTPQRISYFNGPPGESLLDTLANEDGEGGACELRRCTANRDCCEGGICVHIDGVEGECRDNVGEAQGSACSRDEDCEHGLLCNRAAGGNKVCQPKFAEPRRLGQSCEMSSDCDVSKHLCCQLKRRARMKAAKVCDHFEEANTCVGPVDEKAISANPYYFQTARRGAIP